MRPVLRMVFLASLVAATGCGDDDVAPMATPQATTCGVAAPSGTPLQLHDGTRTLLEGKPFAVGVSSAGVAYVSQTDSQAVAQLTLPAFSFDNRVPIGNAPVQVAFNSSGTRAYVTTANSPSVAVIDVATGTVTSHVSVTGDAYGIVVAPGDSVVWVGTSVDSVFGISTASGTIGHRIKIGSNSDLPSSLAACDSLLYVADGDVVAELATRRDALRTTFPIPGAWSMVVASDNRHIYVVDLYGKLHRIDFPSGTVATVSISGGAVLFDDRFSIAQSPADGRLYVTTADGGKVVVVDPNTLAKVDSFLVGGRVHEIAFNATGTVAVVANGSGWVDFLQQ